MCRDLEDLVGRKVDLVSDGTLLPFAQETANISQYAADPIPLKYERKIKHNERNSSSRR